MHRRNRSTPAELVRVYAHETCARLREAAALRSKPPGPFELLVQGAASAPPDLQLWRRATLGLCAAAELDRYREPGLEALRALLELELERWPNPVELLEVALGCARLLSERAALGEALLGLGALGPARGAFAELLEEARSPRLVERGLLGLASWSALQGEARWSAQLCAQARHLPGATRAGRLRGLALALWLGELPAAEGFAAGLERRPGRAASAREVRWLAELAVAVAEQGRPFGLLGAAGLEGQAGTAGLVRATPPGASGEPPGAGRPVGELASSPPEPDGGTAFGTAGSATGPGSLRGAPCVGWDPSATDGPVGTGPAGTSATAEPARGRGPAAVPARSAAGFAGRSSGSVSADRRGLACGSSPARSIEQRAGPEARCPGAQQEPAAELVAWVRVRRHAPGRLGALCRALLPG
jgi:hypothetical protein